MTQDEINRAIASTRPDPSQDWRTRAGLEAQIDVEGREMQARFDGAYNSLNQRAPQRVFGESMREYELRLLRPLQVHSKKYSKSNLAHVHDATALRVVGDDIRADAIKVSRANVGPLREVTETDGAGRRITRFFGEPGAVWDRFKMPYRFVKAWNNEKVF